MKTRIEDDLRCVIEDGRSDMNGGESMQHMWTIIQHDGPDHLGLWLNQAARSYTSRRSRRRVTTGRFVLLPFAFRRFALNRFSNSAYLVQVEAVSSFLADRGVEVVRYHGSMSPKARQDSHHKFIHDLARVIVATIAYGLGIDKPE